MEGDFFQFNCSWGDSFNSIIHSLKFSQHYYIDMASDNLVS